MKLKLLLLLSVIILHGCSLFKPEIVVKTQLAYTKVTCPDYPAPVGIKMQPVKPRAVFDATGLAWIGLTPRHYGNLSVNLQEFIRYTKAQKGQTNYYRNCILSFNVEIERLQDLEKSHD